MKINNYNAFLFNNRINILNESLINEEAGFKDVVLGFALIAGVIAGNVTTSMAQSKLSDKETIQNIQSVLKDKDKLNSVIDTLEKNGMYDAADIIQNNASSVSSELKKVMITSKDMAIKTGDYKSLASNLKRGWAISKVTVRKSLQIVEKDTTISKNTTISIDTLELNWSNDKLFEIGSYELQPRFIDSLQSVFSQLHDNDLSIIKIQIESSTDKQRIKSDGSAAKNLSIDGYDVSNKGLSQARNDSLKGAIENIFDKNGYESPGIQQIVLHDEGKGQDNAATEQDPSARYVKVVIFATHIQMNPPTSVSTKITTKEEVLAYSFRLAKAKNVEIGVTVDGKIKKVKSKSRTYGKVTCQKGLGFS